jgi:hypothetical protein
MDFYKKKYLKYKTKYLDTKKSLKGGNPEKKILLMFLGGAITAPNLIKHYTIMNEQFSKKDNFYIVIHPISLPYEVNEEFKKIFNQDNIFIVDENHHLLTAWATKSLTDATLMMMQYAHIQNSGNLFDKYILLSPNCCPLYTFDKIYDYLTLNNKSFINFSNGIHTNPSDISFDYFRSAIRTGSQWIIIDKQHIIIYFPISNVDMYSKEIKTNCKQINKDIETIQINLKYNRDSNLKFLKLYLDFFNNRGKCNITDESFFQSSILHFLFNNIDINTAQIINWGNPKEKFDIEQLILKKNLYIFNFYNTKYKIFNFPIELKEKLKKVLLNLNDNKVIYIFPLSTSKGDNNFTNNPEYINNVFEDLSNPLNNQGMASNTYTTIDNNIKKYIKKSYYPTWVDWLYTSIEPNNFLRDFKYSNIINNEDIIFYLKNNPIINYCNLNENISDCNIFVKNKLECIKTLNPRIKKNMIFCISEPYTHPLEYSCWNIKSILNAFILINKLNCLIPTDTTIYDTPENKSKGLYPYLDRYYHIFNCVYHIYKKILIFYFDINDPEIIKTYEKNWKNYKDRYEIEKDNNIDNSKLIDMILAHKNLDTILEIKLGTYVTHNTLIAAINEGSLFIRKCYDTSFIEEYSHILKDCNIIDNQDDKIEIPDIECILPKIPMYSWDEDFALQNLKK